jgi:hypothetical protein
MTKLSCSRMFRLHARPLPTSPVSKLSLFLSLTVCGRSSLLTGEGKGGGGHGAESYDHKKAGASINLQSSLPAVRQIRRDVRIVKNVCSLKKIILSKIEHRPLWLNFTVTNYKKLPRFTVENILPQYCSRASNQLAYIL